MQKNGRGVPRDYTQAVTQAAALAELTAHQENLAALAARRKQEEEAAKERAARENTPARVLTNAYRSYIVVKRCYDVRQGYLSVYISDPEMAEAGVAIRLIEKQIEPQLNSGVHLDTLWSDADKGVQNQYGQRSRLLSADDPFGRSRGIRHRELSALFEIRTRLYPESAATKKDF